MIEIRRVGYWSLAFEVSLYPGESITYRRAMEPAGVEPAAPAIPLAPAFEEGAVLPAPAEADGPSGAMTFDVSPTDAEIYVDGFYSGLVNDFNGSHRLRLTAGRHHLSLRMSGYETVETDVSIASEETITNRTTLKQLR